MVHYVYLAGPISGLSYGGATEWRDVVCAGLRSNLVPLCPMRGKDYLESEESIADDYADTLLSSQRSITTRDRNDVIRLADALIVNLLGAEKVSIGTMIELGWADSKRVPIIVVMEDKGNSHDHSMVREIATHRVNNLNDAISIVNALFYFGV